MPGASSLKTLFRARTKPQRQTSGELATSADEVEQSKEIVVKFPETYNIKAHRLLADAGLAPKVFFDSSEPSEPFTPAGRAMIVMERVRGKDLSQVAGPVPNCVRDSVAKALDILHDHDIVFGDLRRPNVLAVEDASGCITGGMLVDFDWCGKHGEARYPPAMNTEDIRWPDGVDKVAIMLKEHDRFMFARL